MRRNALEELLARERLRARAVRAGGQQRPSAPLVVGGENLRLARIGG